MQATLRMTLQRCEKDSHLCTIHLVDQTELNHIAQCHIQAAVLKACHAWSSNFTIYQHELILTSLNLACASHSCQNATLQKTNSFKMCTWQHRQTSCRLESNAFKALRELNDWGEQLSAALALRCIHELQYTRVTRVKPACHRSQWWLLQNCLAAPCMSPHW